MARFTKELDKTNIFVKFKKQCTVEVLNKSVKKMTLVVSIKKTSVFTCMVQTVSWNVIIPNNINDNSVNSKQYTVQCEIWDFWNLTTNCKVKYG